MTPKVYTAKVKMDKCTVKRTISRVKRKLMEWEKVSANFISDKE
jgi:hypothetical protein